MNDEARQESAVDAVRERMPVRIMDFEIDPQLVRDALPELFPGYGISMTLPYLEPYLVRTMRAALEHCTDPVVAQEVRQFIGQEAQHFRQHAVLNDMIRSISPELEGLREIEDQLEADYQRFTNTKSLKFNLAYAEGFEAATFAGGRANFRNNVFDRLETIQNTDLLRLFIWHALEEVEHSTVTFNIYDHLYGDYLYRLVAGTYGQYHFLNTYFCSPNSSQRTHLRHSNKDALFGPAKTYWATERATFSFRANRQGVSAWVQPRQSGSTR